MERRSRIPLRFGVAAAAVAALVLGIAAPSGPVRTVRVAKQEGGAVRDTRGRVDCGTRCVARLPKGVVLDLRAAPVSPFEFSRWGGWCVGAAPRCVLVLDRPTFIRPSFSRLPGTVEAIVGGRGSLVSNPGGLQCGREARDCEAEFGQGSIAELFAGSDSGWTIRSWSGACAGPPGVKCRLLVGASQSVGVVFGRLSPAPGPQRLTFLGEYNDYYKLTSDPPGIDCPPTCAADFPSATLVTLRPGYRSIREWTRGCIGLAETCTVSVDEPTTVQVAPPPPVSAPPPPIAEVRLTVAGPGTVVGPRLACGVGRTACRSRGRGFSQFRLVARPRAGARFGGWRGACTGARPSCSVYVESGIRDIVAWFRPRR